MIRLSVEELREFRLRRHHLVEQGESSNIAKIVSDVCGIQSQVLSSAELALRARVREITQKDVHDALWKCRSLVKTWCMRGTLHLLASSDLRVYVSAMEGKASEFETWLKKSSGVEKEEIRLITKAVGEALGSRSLTREELSLEVERRVTLRPSTRKLLRSGWGVLLRPAAFEGRLSFGENLGQLVTFCRPKLDPRPRSLDTTRALGILFERYLGCYGPATTKEFGHWWGGFRSEGTEFINEALDLEKVEVAGRPMMMRSGDAEGAHSFTLSKTVRLLPSFDCYVMFYSPRESLVAEEYRSRIFRKEAGWVYPSLVVDGKAVGIWTTRKHARRMTIEVERFRPLTGREMKGLAQEAMEIGEFLGLETTLQVVDSIG